MPVSLTHCRIVLVRTQFAGNLGAAARVMRNFGLTDLVLVDPEARPTDHQARVMATHGEPVLDSARVVSDLSTALADCLLVVGTSALTDGLLRRQPRGTPEEIIPHVLQALRHGPAALVFGPEASGLTNAELTRCHYLLHLPTEETAPALNLAQAVAVCSYELRRAWLQEAGPPADRPQPAPFAELEHMFGQLQASLEQIHFLYEPNGVALMHALRHLIGRAQPTSVEVNILRGLARQIRWYVQHQGGQAAQE